MNEELQNTLASVLEKSMEVAEKTGQWALDMAPELIEQYLMWELVSSIIILSICLLVISLPFILKWYIGQNFNFDEAEHGIPMFLSIICAIIAFVLIPLQLHTILFIKIAPEIYLIKNLL